MFSYEDIGKITRSLLGISYTIRSMQKKTTAPICFLHTPFPRKCPALGYYVVNGFPPRSLRLRVADGLDLMILLYFAVAYLVGIAAGQLLWQQGWFGCGISDVFWLLALALLPICLWMDATAVPRVAAPMRWPASAGFSAPRRSPFGWLIGGLLLAGLCGALRLASHPPLPCWEPSDLAYYNTDEGDSATHPTLTVDGYVAGYPLQKDGRQRLDIEAETVWLEGAPQPVTGRIRLQTGSRHDFRFGERVRVTGQLTEPPIFDGFDYRAYLARKQIHSLMQRPRVEPHSGLLRGGVLLRGVYHVRARGEALLNRLLPEPYAALANGMLLGIEAGIPDDLYEKFNMTGASHVIVISGSNVALVAGVLMALCVRLFGRRYALWPTLAVLGLYTLLVGGDAAVMRASLMGGLFVLATVLGRQSTALVSLAAACWVMTLVNPHTVWDVGFQFSGAATAGLILFGPVLTDWVRNLWGALTAAWTRRRPAPETEMPQAEFLMPSSVKDLLRDSLLMTIAASATTLPLIVYYFDRLSIISLLTNLLIAPVQPWIMIGGGLGLIVGALGLEQVAQVLLWVPYASLWWTVAMVRWNAALPGGSVEIVSYSGVHMAATYAVIFGLYWRRPMGRFLAWLWAGIVSFFGASRDDAADSWLWALFPQRMPSALFGGMGIVALLLWWLALTQPDGQLHVHFLDIGQGDGIFIQTPSGRQILIDGGSDDQQLIAELGEVMPFWDRDIDLAVLTHPDWDHMGGQIGLPERFEIEQAIISESTRDHEDSEAWLKVLGGADVPVVGLWQGGWLDLGDGVALWALWPLPEEEMRGIDADDKNERSLVLKLVYGEFSVLLTGDAGLPSEKRLLRAGQPVGAQVLKVGHHGSESSSWPAFVEAVGASVAVIQVGAGNSYEHPRPEVLETLGGRLVLRNDEDGRVHIRSDGRLMWIETENGEISEILDGSDVRYTQGTVPR